MSLSREEIVNLVMDGTIYWESIAGDVPRIHIDDATDILYNHFASKIPWSDWAQIRDQLKEAISGYENVSTREEDIEHNDETIEGLLAEYDSFETREVRRLQERLRLAEEECRRAEEERHDAAYDLEVAESNLIEVANQEGWEI